MTSCAKSWSFQRKRYFLILKIGFNYQYLMWLKFKALIVFSWALTCTATITNEVNHLIWQTWTNLRVKEKRKGERKRKNKLCIWRKLSSSKDCGSKLPFPTRGNEIPTNLAIFISTAYRDYETLSLQLTLPSPLTP